MSHSRRVRRRLPAITAFAVATLLGIAIAAIGVETAEASTTRTLTVALAGSGTGTVQSDIKHVTCPKSCTAKLKVGAVVTLTATASPGSVFEAWSGACTGTGVCTVTMTSDLNVTATFTPPPATALTVNVLGQDVGGDVTSSPAGINCIPTCAANYPAGTAVTLTAHPAVGVTFSGWSGGCTAAALTCTVTLDGSKSVNATFTPPPPPPPPDYELGVTVSNTDPFAAQIQAPGVVTSTPTGISCDGTASGTCTQFVANGATVTLTATPGPNVTFTGWSGACAGTTATCTFTMDTTKAVTASFVYNAFIGVSSTGTGSGTVTSNPSGISCGQIPPITCNTSFAPGTSVTLTATPNPGSTFAGWSNVDAPWSGCTGTIPTCTLPLAAWESHVETATFS